MGGDLNFDATMPDGSKVDLVAVTVDFGFLELYGLHPVVGRFFAPEHGGDSAPLDPKQPFHPAVVVNDGSARDGLRYRPVPSERRWFWPTAPQRTVRKSSVSRRIFLDLSASANTSDALFRQSASSRYASSLIGHDIPGNIDGNRQGFRAATGASRPIARIFISEYVRDLFTDLARQSQLFIAFAGVALFIAGLGLFGLSVFTAERRTKEIGIRKAMGASRLDIVRLLLWQFAAGAMGKPDRLAGRGLFDEPLVARFRPACGTSVVDFRRSNRNRTGDRSAHRIHSRFQGRHRTAGEGAQI